MRRAVDVPVRYQVGRRHVPPQAPAAPDRLPTPRADLEAALGLPALFGDTNAGTLPIGFPTRAPSLGCVNKLYTQLLTTFSL
jgi:hypothetical protein